MEQIGEFPVENGHGNSVASAQISLHLKLQIVHRIEAQVIVESFLLIAMTALDLSVVPWRSRADGFVGNAVFCMKQIQRMHVFRLYRATKLAAIVGLYDLWRIAKEGDCTLHKIHRRKTVLPLIRIGKPLLAGFFDHGIFKKILYRPARHSRPSTHTSHPFATLRPIWKVYRIFQGALTSFS